MVKITVDRTEKGLDLGFQGSGTGVSVEISPRALNSLIATLVAAQGAPCGWGAQLEMRLAELEISNGKTAPAVPR